MRKPSNALLVASSLVLAVPITGCALGGERSSATAAKAGSGEIGLAIRAQAALEQGDAAAAIGYAERAVENRPGEAGIRALLGNAYLSAGRFRSAEAAFADALALAPGLPGLPLKLALTQAALGKSDQALLTLDRNAGVIDAADAGLAMAVAGRPDAGVELLDRVARVPGADARVRQNLALAYALSGDWVRARSIAAQDVPGDQLEARMAEWSSFASSSQPNTRVAVLIGVSPATADAGQPERLALRGAGSSVHMAERPQPAPIPADAGAATPMPFVGEAATAAAPPAAPMPMVAVAAAEPMPVAVPSAPAHVEEQPAPAPAAAAPDVADMLDSLRREPVRASNKLPKVAELRRSAARRFQQSRTVVQLGAYATEAGVRMGWSAVSARHRALRAFIPASARFNGPGGTVYRLSLKGFSSDREARQVCMQLKASGGSCFVRTAAGDSAVRFASR
jgi:Flp pilus assembly protein TadD